MKINYKIKSVKGFLFKTSKGNLSFTGLSLYDENLGFVTFDGDDGKPYTPCGGKKALLSIINHPDGFINDLHVKQIKGYRIKNHKLTKINE